MSMGTFEAYYQVVPETVLKKVVGAKLLLVYTQAMNALVTAVQRLGYGNEAINEAYEGDFGAFQPDLPEWVEFKAAEANITSEFHRQTDLGLALMYTDGDGDRYDDLEAKQWYWILAEDEVWVRKLTPAAEAFCKKYSTKKQSAIELDSRYCRFG